MLSNVEINFSKKKIEHISAAEPDAEIPFDVSNNLNALIPQLLVNIQQQDDAMIARWTKENIGQPVPVEFPEAKLPRFKSAYNKIFDGHKTFQGIIVEDKEHKVMFADSAGNSIDVADLSSGEKQIVFRLGFVLKDLETIENGTVLIDEPEISLHPRWQLNFKKVLLEVFLNKNVQIIIATHSPYIFGEIDPNIEECIRIDKVANTSEKIEFPQVSLIPSINSSPSMSLINYKAFGIASTSLHIELYNTVQSVCGKDSVAAAERWLIAKTISKSNYSISGRPNYLNDDGTDSGHSAEETMPTWIRNYLNHPMTDRKKFDESDLEKSIDLMLNALS